jgi:superfamily I DNA and/or RNA helicase
LEKIGLSKKDSLSTSIFERLSRKLIGTDAFITLKYQYRMNDIICKFSSDQFYDGVIKAGEINKRSVGDQTLADFFKAYNIQNINFDNRSSSAYFFHPDLPFIFINTESIQLYDSTVSSKVKGSPADASSQTESIFNIGEAKVVVSILKFFLHKICEVSRPTEEILEIVSKIGVISGFRAQNQTIRELLTEELMNPNSDVLKRLSNPREIADNIIIDTVDRFQGQEREIIIFSCVDSNPDSILSNNNREVRRMNVSITRAKKKLIFIGNGKTLAKINPEDEEETKNAKKMFQNLMDFAEKNEGLIRFT